MKITLGPIRIHLFRRMNERFNNEIWLGVTWDKYLPIIGCGFIKTF